MERKELNWTDVPAGWALCLTGECPSRESCLRWQAGQLVPESLVAARLVLPRRNCDEACRMFAPIRTVRNARGFMDIYNAVRKQDYTPMRLQMTALFSGKRRYYESMHGKQPVSPEMQQRVRNLFARWGYADSVRFDSYEEDFCFPCE